MLQLMLAPDPIYKIVCTPVTAVDDAVRHSLDAMMELAQEHHAMGIGAPMVGLTQRLVVIALADESGVMHRYKMVNPTITERSDEMRTTEEASITFLGVSAPVTRPASITLDYLDEQGIARSLQASGLLATCIQHEIDYLDGKTFLDYQPPMKRDMMRRKMEKQKRLGLIPHVHGAHCQH